MSTVILPVEAVDAPGRIVSEGYIEFYGQAHAAGGWLFCGWCRDLWPSRQATAKAFVRFLRASPLVEATFCFYLRPDLPSNCVGLILFAPSAPRSPGELISIDLEGEDPNEGVRTVPIRPVAQLRETELIAKTISLARSAYGNPLSVERINALLARRTYSGQDTLANLTSPVACEVDTVVRLPDLGLLVIGWLVDADQSVATVQVRCGDQMGLVTKKQTVVIPRPDVADAVGRAHGYEDPNCGFMWLVPMRVDPEEVPYLEIEMLDGSIGHKPIPIPKLKGLSAVKHILTHARLDPLKINETFGSILAPAVQSLNRDRLRAEREFEIRDFGVQPSGSTYSVIVPLYGRIDFLEYQMAVFSTAPDRKVEYIYVLDDPQYKEQLIELARSTFARFNVPFRLVLLRQNWGYAPANNVGLKLATGEFTCFLNSDVIPRTADWLSRLSGRLEVDPSVGIVGALLQFEDETIQHAGIAFEYLEEFGNWPFPYHPGKGRVPSEKHMAYQEVEAVTGACMVLRTELARSLGGFDEEYAIGDFEDTDLCMKIRASGLLCTVDGSVRLWHLERQSQSTAVKTWRMYLTLTNAWIHRSRWFVADNAS